MKGVVFTEFLEMVESRFSYAMSEQIIEAADLPSGGVYTSVGTYDHAEIVALVSHLSRATNTPVPDLLKAFGHHLFFRFVAGYPAFFEGVTGTADFMQRVDNYIHVEVRKLYPDAQLPKLEYEQPAPNVLKVTYRSIRPFADLAEGLIRGCIEHYQDGTRMTREDIQPGTVALFTLTR